MMLVVAFFATQIEVAQARGCTGSYILTTVCYDYQAALCREFNGQWICWKDVFDILQDPTEYRWVYAQQVTLGSEPSYGCPTFCN
jgi:hypothetical protein